MLYGYGFAYEGNKFDFCEVMLQMKPASAQPEDLVCLDNTETVDIQEVRLKTDQLEHTMMAYLRLVVKVKQEAPSRLNNLLDVASSGDVSFMEAEECKSKEENLRALQVEHEVLSLYKEVLVLQITHQEKETTLQEDMEILNKPDIPF